MGAAVSGGTAGIGLASAEALLRAGVPRVTVLIGVKTCNVTPGICTFFAPSRLSPRSSPPVKLTRPLSRILTIFVAFSGATTRC